MLLPENGYMFIVNNYIICAAAVMYKTRGGYVQNHCIALAIAKNKDYETRILDPSWHDDDVPFDSPSYWELVNKNSKYKVDTIYQIIFTQGNPVINHYLVFLKYNNKLGLPVSLLKDLRFKKYGVDGPRLFIKDKEMTQNLNFNYKNEEYKKATETYFAETA